MNSGQAGENICEQILAYRSGQFEVLLREPIEPHLLSRYPDNLWHH